MNNEVNEDFCHYNGVRYLPAPETRKCSGCAFDEGDDCTLQRDPNVEFTYCQHDVRKDGRGIIWVRADGQEVGEEMLPTIQQLYDSSEIIFRRDSSGDEDMASHTKVVARYGIKMLMVKFLNREYLMPMSAHVKASLGGGYYAVDGYFDSVQSHRISLGFFNTVPVKL